MLRESLIYSTWPIHHKSKAEKEFVNPLKILQKQLVKRRELTFVKAKERME
jgi:hypothetical protein